MAKLCDTCSAKWQGALEAKMGPPPIQLVVVGRPTAESITAGLTRRADEFYARVRDYQAWISENCKRDGSKNCGLIS